MKPDDLPPFVPPTNRAADSPLVLTPLCEECHFAGGLHALTCSHNYLYSGSPVDTITQLHTCRQFPHAGIVKEGSSTCTHQWRSDEPQPIAHLAWCSLCSATQWLASTVNCRHEWTYNPRSTHPRCKLCHAELNTTPKMLPPSGIAKVMQEIGPSNHLGEVIMSDAMMNKMGFRGCPYRRAKDNHIVRLHRSSTPLAIRRGKTQWSCDCGESQRSDASPVWVETVFDERRRKVMFVANLADGRHIGISFSHTLADKVLPREVKVIEPGAFKVTKTTVNHHITQQVTHCRLYDLTDDKVPPLLLVDATVARHFKDPQSKEVARTRALTKALGLLYPQAPPDNPRNRAARTVIWKVYHERPRETPQSRVLSIVMAVLDDAIQSGAYTSEGLSELRENLQTALRAH